MNWFAPRRVFAVPGAVLLLIAIGCSALLAQAETPSRTTDSVTVTTQAVADVIQSVADAVQRVVIPPQTDAERPEGDTADTPTAPPPFSAGLRQLKFSCPNGAAGGRQCSGYVWYPSTAPATQVRYGGQWGEVAEDAPVAAASFPLIVFSHGFLGAGDQLLYLTEALARQGYVVAAVDHQDSARDTHGAAVQIPNFIDITQWDDARYWDRREDLRALIDELLRNNDDPGSWLVARIDADRIGAMGHSLGGYVVLGMAGARPPWRDSRVHAALLMSPYALPYLAGRQWQVDIPVMVQGGTLDWAITPFLFSLYGSLTAPKYYLVLNNADHMAWTNNLTHGRTTREAVAAGNARWIAGYALAFFDRHLAGRASTLSLDQGNRALNSYRYQTR